jgi:hypothetical protein
MNFIGYPLNMPHYFLRSLYKMSKRFKREKADSSLFHHGLIKLIIVHHLSLMVIIGKPSYQGMALPIPSLSQIDKVVVTETLVGPAVPFHILLPPVKPSDCPDIDLPDAIANPCTKDKTEAVKKPVRKKGKNDTTVNSKGKKNARLISRLLGTNPSQTLTKSQ